MTADTVEVDLLGSLPESVVLAALFAAVCMFILWLPAVRLSWAICHELEGQLARISFQPSCGGGWPSHSSGKHCMISMGIDRTYQLVQL